LTKNLGIFNKKNASKLSEIWSEKLIRYIPDPDFLF
jgi:hypothetical protein